MNTIMETEHEVNGVNAIVTGAQGGIGKAIVQKLALHGCNVWVCSRKINESFEAEIDLIAKNNKVWINPIYFDLNDESEIKAGIKTIMSEKKDIDLLVNVAGIGHMGLFPMMSMEDIKRIYQVNLFAPMLLSQLVGRKMCKQKHGCIINISSTAGKEVHKGNTVYGPSKSALNLFTRCLAAEYGESGVRVNAIAPGLTDTDMSGIFEGNNPDAPLEHTVLRRKIAPEEIADIVIGLISKEMSLINGQIIVADGGTII